MKPKKDRIVAFNEKEMAYLFSLMQARAMLGFARIVDDAKNLEDLKEIVEDSAHHASLINLACTLHVSEKRAKEITREFERAGIQVLTMAEETECLF